MKRAISQMAFKQIANTCMEKCLTSFPFGECKLNPERDAYSHLLKWLNEKDDHHQLAEEEYAIRKFLSIVGQV